MDSTKTVKLVKRNKRYNREEVHSVTEGTARHLLKMQENQKTRGAQSEIEYELFDEKRHKAAQLAKTAAQKYTPEQLEAAMAHLENQATETESNAAETESENKPKRGRPVKQPSEGGAE